MMYPYQDGKHPNLSFTCEVGPKSLPFLDVQVDFAGCPVFSVFRKPTFTGLLLNFDALCPNSWKKALVFCFLKRAFVICSNWSLFHKEVLKLKRTFVLNGYSEDFFNHAVNRFLSKCLVSSNDVPRRDSIQYTLVLPYFGKISDKFRLQFRRLSRKYNLDCRLVFKPFKVSTYFSLKSVVPDVLKSCLVYKYVCSKDSTQIYIGKTKRHFLTRIREHGTSNSAITGHCNLCSCFSINNFSVLRCTNSEYDAVIAEALFIRKIRPSLNNTISNSGQSTFLKL